MGMVAKDVRWAVNAADREAAPWFGIYQGKRSLPDFFAELAKLTFTDFTLKAVLSDGDLVITWLHVAFTSPLGRDVDMEEVQIWQLADGKVASVDTLLDTAAVAAAFACEGHQVGRARPRLPDPAGRRRTGRRHPGGRLAGHPHLHLLLPSCRHLPRVRRPPGPHPPSRPDRTPAPLPPAGPPAARVRSSLGCGSTPR